MAETILARDYCKPDYSQVDAAHQIATAAVAALSTQDRVRISMEGVLGAASSFFNVILLEVVEALGREAITSRLEFKFSLRHQEDVYRRSLMAVLQQPQ